MSAAAPSEALATAMLFPQERARLGSVGPEGKCVFAVRAFKVLEAIGCRTTEYDIEPQNRI